MNTIYCRFCRYEISERTMRQAMDTLSLHAMNDHPTEWDQIAQVLASADAKLKTFTNVVKVQEGVWTVEDHSANVTLPVDTTRKEVIV